MGLSPGLGFWNWGLELLFKTFDSWVKDSRLRSCEIHVKAGRVVFFGVPYHKYSIIFPKTLF